MFRRIALVLIIPVFAVSCSNKQIKVPPETLLKQGESLYARKKYEAAAEKWRTAKDGTSSQILKTALELKLADALFNDENYIEAAAEYENFRKLHPKNSKASYALFMTAMSNLKQVEKIDVDQTPITNAAILFETFFKEYPNSVLQQRARIRLAECRSKQAAYEIYVGRFYYRTDKYKAAIGRFKEALEKYPGTPELDEALFLLGNACLRSGDAVTAKESFSRLVTDYPHSKFVNKAKKFLSRNS
ncbi:MAG TPA: outer membrane protein assembly factor BamD [Geobacteraceae bacterium]|nr:outer membrane protein assembly factor BamD [Geobacteraceae bacterium]